MNLFFTFGLVAAFILYGLAMVFLGLWVYRDARNRGVSAGLWTAVVLLVPNLIGLLLYFLVGRKQAMVQCAHCGAEVLQTAHYCSSCGETLTVRERTPQSSTKGFIIGFALCGVLLIVGFAVFMGLVLTDGNLPTNSSISIGLVQNNIGSNWSVSYVRSNEVFTKTITLSENGPKTLYIEAECKEGRLQLLMTQGEKEQKIDLNTISGVYEYDLSKFDDGLLTLRLIGTDARDIRFKAHWE